MRAQPPGEHREVPRFLMAATMKSRSYQADLHKALKSPVEAAEYMKAALEEGDPEVFLVALRDVAAAILNEGKDLDCQVFPRPPQGS